MKLYAGRLSLFSRKVEIALAEKGIAYEREFVPFTQERGYAPKHPAVIAHNPKRQVPVLVDGDLALFDSTVIFEYLEELYPSPPLYPTTPQERARCRLLEVDADEILFQPVRSLLFRTEPPHPDDEARRTVDASAEFGSNRTGARRPGAWPDPLQADLLRSRLRGEADQPASYLEQDASGVQDGVSERLARR